MAGIDRIKEVILQEARAKVDTILGEAGEAAEQTLTNAREEARTLEEETVRKAADDAADYAQKIQSQIGMQQRQAILRAKQDMIAQVLEEAYERLAGAPDESYFAMILDLAAKNIQPGEGQILFNKKDQARLPADLASKLAKLAAEKGSRLSVSTETADIDSGFVLRYRPEEPSEDGEAVPPVQAGESSYGTVELNCSLRSLIAEKKDELSDLVFQKLF